VNLTY